MIKKIKLKCFKKKSGKLIAFSTTKSLPFKIKRFFIINGEKGFTRGDHAHKKCSQFLFPLIGKIKILSNSKDGKKNILLDSSKNEGYLLKPKTWCKINFITKHSTLLVACDMEYKFSDYIEKYSEFLKIIKKKNK